MGDTVAQRRRGHEEGQQRVQQGTAPLEELSSARAQPTVDRTMHLRRCHPHASSPFFASRLPLLLSALLLLLLPSCCSPLILPASAQLVSVSLSDISSPDVHRVTNMFSCAADVGAAPGYTLSYEWVLTPPAGSSAPQATYAGAAATTALLDFKQITKAMAFVKHMTVSCRVTMTDAASVETSMESEGIQLMNTPPEISRALLQVSTVTPLGTGLSSTSALTLDALVCSAPAPTDIDDPEPGGAASFDGFLFQFMFYINGALVQNRTVDFGKASLVGRPHVANDTLPPGSARRGDEVYCTATPGDSMDWGTTRSSSVLSIGVTPPQARGVVVVSASEEEVPLRRNDAALCAVGSVYSADNDTEDAYSFEYEFSINGVSVANQSSPVLLAQNGTDSSNSTHNDTSINNGTLPPLPLVWVRGDRLSCRVRVSTNVSDVLYPGAWVSSSSDTTVANTPPTTGSVSLTPASPTVLTDLVCAPDLESIFDVDGDEPVSFVYAWTKDGAPVTFPNGTAEGDRDRITTQSGLLAYNATFSCTVAASDGQDLGPPSPPSSVRLVKAPLVLASASVEFDDPSVPSAASCTPGELTDPDAGIYMGEYVVEYKYTWTVDGVLQQSADNSTNSTDDAGAGLFEAQTLFLSNGSFTLGPNHTLSCTAQAVESVSGVSSSVASSGLRLLDAPRIVSFTARSSTNKANIYTSGIELTIHFSGGTNFGVLDGTLYALGSTPMPKAVVDSLLGFSADLGTDYTALWTSPSSIVLTVLNPLGATPPAIGHTKAWLVQSAQVRFAPSNEDGAISLVSNQSNSLSGPLAGNFGTAAAGFLWSVLRGSPGSDQVAPLEFTVLPGEKTLGAAAGTSHAFVITSGNVYAVGLDEDGQSGIRDTVALAASFPSYASNYYISALTPVDSLSNRSISSISAGVSHSLALTREGRILVAGDTSLGRCGLGLYGDTYASMQKTDGFMELALNASSGELYAATAAAAAAEESPFSESNPNFSFVAAGYDFSVAVRTDATGSIVYAWGSRFGSSFDAGTVNTAPQRVTMQESDSDVRFVAVAAGKDHVLLLSSDGEVWGWGRNVDGQLGLGAGVSGFASPRRIPSLSLWSISSISAGASHSLLVTNHSSVLCFGKNGDGQCGVQEDQRVLYSPTLLPSALFNHSYAAMVAAGETGSFFTNYGGDVYAFGYSDRHALGVDEDYVPAPRMVAGLAESHIAAVYFRKFITVALTPVTAPPCPTGCNNHGTCTGGSCQCASGWTGPDCAIPVCPTANDGRECGGNGTCVVRNGLPTCQCDAGLTGPDCTQPDCVSNGLLGCSGRGTCAFIPGSSSNARQCICDAGSTGPDCATCAVGWGPEGQCNQLNCSAWDWCSDHGTCVLVGDVGQCQCHSGWTGSTCSIRSCPGTDLGICGGHGRCVALPPSSVADDGALGNSSLSICACEDRWSGTTCDQPLCAGSPPCSQHGSCEVRSGRPVCSCAAGFLALDCSIPSCAGDPLHECSGHGTCIVLDGAPACACDENYSGTDCADKDSLLNAMVVALIVVGVLVGTLLLCAGLFACIKRGPASGGGGGRGGGFFDPIAPRKSNRVHVFSGTM